MPALTFALSADYARATGGYIYDQRLMAELERLGWNVDRLALPPGFPRPTPPAVAETAEAFAALPDGAILVTDQLCLGVLPELAAVEGRRLRLVMIVHHPLAREGYGGSDVNETFFRSERDALAHASLVIVSSPATAASLVADYDVPASRMAVAPPGTDPLPLSNGAGGAVPHLLGVGAIVPRKGHDQLIEALGCIGDLPWRATLVGNVDRAPERVARVRQLIARSGLAERISLTGELPEAMLAEQWRTADVFVSASRHEGYGMAASEAIARGLPVVATHAGIIGDWIDPEASDIVATDDVSALATALRRVVGEESHRARMRAAAMAARDRLTRWSETGSIVHRRLLALAASA